MTSPTYNLVSITKSGGHLNHETFSLDEYEHVGVNDSPRSREELQGQPLLEGYLGPYYDGATADGSPVIRYETQEVYDELTKSY